MQKLQGQFSKKHLLFVKSQITELNFKDNKDISG